MFTDLRVQSFVCLVIMSLCACGVHAGAAPPLLLEDQFIYEAEEHTPYNHASNLIALPDGSLLAFWGTGEDEFSRDLQVVMSRHTAGTEDWSPPRIIAQAGDENAANPVPFLDSRGRLWLFYNRRPEQSDPYWRPDRPFPHQRSYIVRRVSEDLGETWGPETVVTRQPGSQLRCLPIVLTNGDWLLPVHDERDMTTFMLVSTDEGGAWQPSEKLVIPGGGTLRPDEDNYREGGIEPAVLQRNDGTVVCYMRYMWHVQTYPPLLWKSVSADNGRSWTVPEQTDFFNPNSGIALLRLDTGNWLLAFNDSSADRRPLVLALSRDEGRTWALQAPVKYGMGRYSYPSLVQTQDGHLHLSYTFFRYDPSTKQAGAAGIRHAVTTEAQLLERGWPIDPED